MGLQEIEAFLRRTKMPPSRFGRLALNDSAFVGNVREGRELLPRTAARVRKFMDEYETGD